MRRLLIALLLVLLAVPSFAQQQAPAPPQLTWVRYYEAPGVKDADFLRSLPAAALDKLVADKTIVAWGVAVPVTHTEETWTHAVYITLQDWTAADAALNALGALPNASRDVILHHLSQSAAPPTVKSKYIGIDTYVVKQGRQGDAVALFDEWAKPIFTDLASKGRLGAWGFSWQENLPGTWTHMVWYFMPDLGLFDDYQAAAMALGPRTLQGFDVRLRDLSESEKHRNQILRIVP